MEPWLLIAAPIVGLAANASVQIVVCRLCGGKRLLRSVVLGFLTGITVAAAWAGLLAGRMDCSATDICIQAMIASLTTAMLGYCYSHFINLGETARRVRILYEFVEAQRPLSKAEILERYNAREMVEKRLERLLSTGQVIERDGHFVLRDRTVLRMAQIMELIRSVLGMRRTTL